MTNEPDAGDDTAADPTTSDAGADTVPTTRRGPTSSEVGPRSADDVTRSRELAEDLEHHGGDPDLVDIAGRAAPVEKAHLEATTGEAGADDGNDATDGRRAAATRRDRR